MLEASSRRENMKFMCKTYLHGTPLERIKFQIFRDLPTEIVKRRRVQMETFKTSKQRGIPAAFSQAQPDKWYIRGRLWPVGKEPPP